MTPSSFDSFRLQSLMEGYDEVIEQQSPPRTLLDMHTHPFAARGVVKHGEMWLTVGDLTRQLRPGDSFQLERGTPHAERYGAEGVVCWVARRHG